MEICLYWKSFNRLSNRLNNKFWLHNSVCRVLRVKFIILWPNPCYPCHPSLADSLFYWLYWAWNVGLTQFDESLESTHAYSNTQLWNHLNLWGISNFHYWLSRRECGAFHLWIKRSAVSLSVRRILSLFSYLLFVLFIHLCCVTPIMS